MLEVYPLMEGHMLKRRHCLRLVSPIRLALGVLLSPPAH